MQAVEGWLSLVAGMTPSHIRVGAFPLGQGAGRVVTDRHAASSLHCATKISRVWSFSSRTWPRSSTCSTGALEMPNATTILSARDVREALAGRALTGRQAKLYSQRLRRDMGREGLASFVSGDVDAYLDEAMLLLECGLLERSADNQATGAMQSNGLRKYWSGCLSPV